MTNKVYTGSKFTYMEKAVYIHIHVIKLELTLQVVEVTGADG